MVSLASGMLCQYVETRQNKADHCSRFPKMTLDLSLETRSFALEMRNYLTALTDSICFEENKIFELSMS